MQLDLRQPAQPINHIDLGILSRLLPCHLSILGLGREKLTSLAAVEDVDHQSNYQPEEESHPRNRRQACHQENAKDHREDRNHRPERHTETTMPLRLTVAQ